MNEKNFYVLIRLRLLLGGIQAGIWWRLKTLLVNATMSYKINSLFYEKDKRENSLLSCFGYGLKDISTFQREKCLLTVKHKFLLHALKLIFLRGFLMLMNFQDFLTLLHIWIQISKFHWVQSFMSILNISTTEMSLPPQKW